MIKEHNANPERTFDMAINSFHDKHESELFFGMDGTGAAHLSKAFIEHDLTATPPTFTYAPSVDWSQRTDIMTPVKNQGNCGSCWAFSSSSALESSLGLQLGRNASNFQISQQHIIECDTLDKGCNGGWPLTAFKVLNNALNSVSYTGGYFTIDGYPSYVHQVVSCRAQANWNNATQIIGMSPW